MRADHFCLLTFYFCLGLLCPATACAAEGKDKPKKFDPEAEAQEAKAEAEQEAKDRIAGVRGKYQRQFHGTFLLPAADAEQDNPEVVGMFLTDEIDKKPNQTYLVKMEKSGMEKEVLESLRCYDGLKVWLKGKLRNHNKYLVVSATSGPEPSPPVKIRQPPGSI